jgi:outer membrane protein assembly factor BamB
MGVNATGCAPRIIEAPEEEATGWSVPLGTSTRAPSADQRTPVEPSLRWRANVRRGAAGPPALGERVVAVSTIDRAVTLLEWETGAQIWRRNLGAPASGAPLLVGSRVYVASTGRQGRVHAISLQRGNKLWDARVGPVVPPIAASPGHVFVGTENGTIRALGARRGESRWSRRLPGVLRCGPVDVGDALLVATDDSLYLMDPADGEILVRAAAPGTVVAPPAWRGDTLVFASPDGIIAGLARDDLRTLWSIPTGDPVFGMPSIARDTAFAVTLGGVLWRVPLATPGDATSVPLGVTVRAPAAPTADGVLVATTAGEVLFFTGVGPVEPRARVDGPIEQAPIIRHGVLLVIDGKGRVYAWQ